MRWSHSASPTSTCPAPPSASGAPSKTRRRAELPRSGLVSWAHPRTKQDQERLARRASFQNLTIADRQARHDAHAAQCEPALDERRALATVYLDTHPGELVVVDPDRAVATASLVQESRACREEAAALLVGRDDASADNGALEFPVLGHEFAADGPVIAFGTSPLVLAPVVRYLGMMPIL